MIMVENNVNNYVLCALVSSLVGNDMKHIHLHAATDNFDDIHDIAQGYYEKISEDTDYLCELCLENGSEIPNLTLAGSLVPSYSISEAEVYEYDLAMKEIQIRIGTYIKYLCQLMNDVSDEDIKNELNEMIRYWKKELNYKLQRRLIGNNDDII